MRLDGETSMSCPTHNVKGELAVCTPDIQEVSIAIDPVDQRRSFRYPPLLTATETGLNKTVV